MKFNRFIWLGMAMSAVLVAGCSSTGSKDGDPGASVEDGSGVSTMGASQGGSWSGNPLDDPNSLLSTRTIYFDFDQSTIRSEYIDVLRTHAGYLNTNRSTAVTIEGHADERGSREYNIALGERRANTITRFLEAEGVSSSQINTLSDGEDRPAAFGNDEASWAENRRGVLVY
jgi:peptidoglycan-associated lipoprotein